MSWRRLEDVLKTFLQDVLKTSWHNVLKTSWRRMAETNIFVLTKTSWRRLEDVLKTFLQDVLKTSWHNVLKTSWRRMAKTNIFVLTKTSWRRLEDIFWRRKAKVNIFVLIKMSWRHFQDVFWRQRQKASSRRLQDIFTKANVCWETTLPTKSSWWNELLFNKNVLAGKQTNYFFLRKVADKTNFYLIKIYRLKLLTVLNERYQKREKTYLGTNMKKHLKDKLSQYFFTGKRSCKYFLITQTPGSNAFC